MKSTILNLIAATTLLFGWTAQAADEMTQKTPPAETTSTVPAASTPVTTPATTEKQQTTVKRSKLHKSTKAKQGRSQNLDLRHCLDLTTYIEIAKCAGE